MARTPGHAAHSQCALSSDDAGTKSSVGIKRSKTASCPRTIICPVTSKPRSVRSSRTTTTGAITRASTILPRPTSTSDVVKPSCWKEKGSNAKPSKPVGCFITSKPHNIHPDAPDSLLDQAACCLKISDDGQWFRCRFEGSDDYPCRDRAQI